MGTDRASAEGLREALLRAGRVVKTQTSFVLVLEEQELDAALRDTGPRPAVPPKTHRAGKGPTPQGHGKPVRILPKLDAALRDTGPRPDILTENDGVPFIYDDEEMSSGPRPDSEFEALQALRTAVEAMGPFLWRVPAGLANPVREAIARLQRLSTPRHGDSRS